VDFRPVVFIAFSVLASASLLSGSDLSRYRNFHVGAPLADVAKQAGMESSEARLISSRPERIEELDWRTNRSASDRSTSDGARPDSVREIRFSFYNGGLFEMMVAYNSGYSTSVRVIAQWSDAENLLSLVGFSDGGGYGAIVSSKANQTLARQAIAESERLDQVEAPQRALDERAKQVADAEARDEKSRLLNKPGFRP
jgi:hypothetical protein